MAEFLKPGFFSDFLKYAKIFASSHHEKWDGTGYHKGLKEDDFKNQSS